jgi:hypothetical protein
MLLPSLLPAELGHYINTHSSPLATVRGKLAISGEALSTGDTQLSEAIHGDEKWAHVHALGLDEDAAAAFIAVQTELGCTSDDKGRREDAISHPREILTTVESLVRYYNRHSRYPDHWNNLLVVWQSALDRVHDWKAGIAEDQEDSQDGKEAPLASISFNAIMAHVALIARRPVEVAVEVLSIEAGLGVDELLRHLHSGLRVGLQKMAQRKPKRVPTKGAAGAKAALNASKKKPLEVQLQELDWCLAEAKSVLKLIKQNLNQLTVIVSGLFQGRRHGDDPTLLVTATEVGYQGPVNLQLALTSMRMGAWPFPTQITSLPDGMLEVKILLPQTIAETGTAIDGASLAQLSIEQLSVTISLDLEKVHRLTQLHSQRVFELELSPNTATTPKDNASSNEGGDTASGSEGGSSTDNRPDGESDLRERLTLYYMQHNPEKVKEIETLLVLYEDREEEVWQDMDMKYGTIMAQGGWSMPPADHVAMGLGTSVGQASPRPSTVVQGKRDAGNSHSLTMSSGDFTTFSVTSSKVRCEVNYATCSQNSKALLAFLLLKMNSHKHKHFDSNPFRELLARGSIYLESESFEFRFALSFAFLVEEKELRFYANSLQQSSEPAAITFHHVVSLWDFVDDLAELKAVLGQQAGATKAVPERQ